MFHSHTYKRLKVAEDICDSKDVFRTCCEELWHSYITWRDSVYGRAAEISTTAQEWTTENYWIARIAPKLRMLESLCSKVHQTLVPTDSDGVPLADPEDPVYRDHAAEEDKLKIRIRLHVSLLTMYVNIYTCINMCT